MRRGAAGTGVGDILLLFALVVAGGVAGRVQNTARKENRLDPLSAALAAVCDPPARFFGTAAGSTAEFSGGLFSARRLAAENAALRDQRARWTLYAEATDRLLRENEALRARLDLPPPPGRQPLEVEVVGFFPRENRLTLSAGASRGVRPGQAVVTGDGLLGVVQTVSPDRCQALLVTSPSIKVGAMVLRHDPPPLGLAQGVDPETLSVPLFEPNAPVRVGDPVVTSGFGERIPRGVVLGRIIQVEDNESFGTRTATVAPAASPGAQKEVTILR